MLAAIFLPVAAALGLEHLRRRFPGLGALPMLVLALVVVARIPRAVPVAIEVGDSVPPVYRWLAVQGAGRPLLEAPIRSGVAGIADIHRDGRAMYLASVHRLPLLNGYGGYAPDSHMRRMEAAARLPEPAALAVLCSETGLGWVLLRRDQLDGAGRRAWETLPPALTVASSFGDEVVLAVDCGRTRADGAGRVTKSATAPAAIRKPAAFGCCVSANSEPSRAAAKAGWRSRQRSSRLVQSASHCRCGSRFGVASST
jgi:hypothetical protein